MILSVSSVPGAAGPKAIAAHRLAVRSVRAPRTMKKSDVKRKKSNAPGFCILPERDGGTCEKRELFFSEEAIRAVRNRRPQPVRLPMRIAAVPFNVLRTEMDAPLKIPETERDAPSHISAAPVGDEYFLFNGSSPLQI